MNGVDPAGSFDLIDRLPDPTCIIGNAELYLLTPPIPVIRSIASELGFTTVVAGHTHRVLHRVIGGTTRLTHRRIEYDIDAACALVDRAHDHPSLRDRDARERFKERFRFGRLA